MIKKYFLLLTLLLLALASSLLFADVSSFKKHHTGLRKPTAKEKAWLAKRPHPFKVPQPNKLAMERFAAAPGTSPGITASAMNAEYLPPVGNQPINSCAAWSSCYYVKTYQDAQQHGWHDLATNSSHVMSPAFGYNLANNGTDDGSYPDVIMQLMCEHGCATMAEMPNVSDYTYWPSSATWKNAITYRANTASTINLSVDSGITALKQLIANGDIAVIGVEVYDNFETYPYESGRGHTISNNVLYANSGADLGGHAVAVIGYDDNRTFTKYGSTAVSSGAFLVINSWGTDWGIDPSTAGIHTAGFIWMSYDYVKNDSGYQKAYVMTDRTGYTPTTFGVFGLNHPARGDLDVQFMGGNSSTHPDWTFDCLPNLGGDISVNQQIVVDLTSFAIDYSKPLWLGVYDSTAYSRFTGQITYMSVIMPGGGEIISSNVPTDTVENSTVYVELNPGFPISITSIAPNTAANTGPVNTAISGGGFAAGSTVKLLSGAQIINAANVVVVSSANITCTFDLTNKPTGYWDVVVTTGSASATLAAGFRITPILVNSISPNSGANTGQVNTTLSGSGFAAGSTVKLSSGAQIINAANVVVVSSANITCTFDLTNKPTGYWDVVVTTGSVSSNLTAGFRITPMLINSVSPSNGVNTYSAAAVAISGNGFVNGSTVCLHMTGQNDIPASSITVVNSNSITCKFDLTGKTTGYWSVIVTTVTNGGSVIATLPAGFRITPMLINSISPTSGVNTGQVNITNLSGNGFVSGSTVCLRMTGQDDIPASSITVVNSNSITCRFDLTDKTTGYWDVIVTTVTNSGPVIARLSSGFRITPMLINSISPTSGVNTGQVNITNLSGNGLVSGSTVCLRMTGQDDIPASSITVVNSNSITCKFDLTGKTTGYWDVVVTTGSVNAVLPAGFRIKPMTVNSISPNNGVNTGQVNTSLSGIGFVAGSTVCLRMTGQDNIPASSITVVNSNSITCKFDLIGKTTGYWDVVVTTGSISASLPAGFRITPMLVNSMSPQFGGNTQPITAQVYGNGFVSGTMVILSSGAGIINPTTMSILSSTAIICTFDLTDKTTGYWDVVVTTGSVSASLPAGFRITPMLIDSISLTSGANTGAVNISDLSGSGFLCGSTITLQMAGQSPIIASSVTFVSQYSIICKFDLTNKTTGYWDVIVSTGSLNASLAAGFRITPMLVSSISPNIGANTGSVNITDLSGSGFVSGSNVKLSAGAQSINAANVSVLSSTAIMCTFDLTGKTTGCWNVVVSTGGTGSMSAVLTNGFQITYAYSAEKVVNPSENAELIINPPSGTTTVNIPAGTFGQTVSVTLSTASAPSPDKPTIKVGNICIEITNSLNLQPNGDITITMHYNPSDISTLGLIESKLAICRYDAVHDLWIPIPYTLDTENHVITATINHFSTFVLVQLAPATSLDIVKVYPNPLNPRTTTAGMTIENLTQNATIKIYNVAGELIRTLNYATANGQTKWDGKNDSGNRVSSGVYILYINSPEGSKKIKVAIEK